MNPDGISYLDMGDAYLRGDWATAINGHFSPLYAVLLALPLHFLRASPAAEMAAVQVVNYVIYLFALCCFNFYLRGTMRQCSPRGDAEERTWMALPWWFWLIFGHVMFVWTSVCLIGVTLVTPDMLVAAFIYLSVGIAARIDGQASAAVFAGFGFLLGIGYLAKSVMGPMGLLFLGVAALSRGLSRSTMRCVLVSLTAFALTAMPLVIALSAAKRRPTLGDSGKLTYAFEVNQVPIVHWRGDPPGSGLPRHPTRKIWENPAVYEFAEPMHVSYSPWYDPSYWLDGVRPHMEPRFWHNLKVNGTRALAVILFATSLLFGAAYMLILTSWRLQSVKTIKFAIANLLPAVTGIALYSAVWVDARYVAAYVVLFWLGVLALVRFGASRSRRTMVRLTASLLTLAVLLQVSPGFLRLAWASQPKPTPALVAERLWKLGIARGDKVAAIGNNFWAYWARLARVRIVAEIPEVEWADSVRVSKPTDTQRFWTAGHSTQGQIVERLRSTGARAIVARRSPIPSGWEEIPGTDYCVYLFSSSQNATAAVSVGRE
ncbi:MAG: hypothetical protein ACLPX8_17870 [Bryobacteraceae bacterium]